MLVMNNIGPAPLGVIVNRPTRIAVARLFPDLEQLATLEDKVYFGGPVDLTKVSFVFRADRKHERAIQVVDGVYFSVDRELLRKLLDREQPNGGPTDLHRPRGLGNRSARGGDRARRLDPCARHGGDDLQREVRASMAREGTAGRRATNLRSGTTKGQRGADPLGCLVGRVGIEPTTNGLRVRCSTS